MKNINQRVRALVLANESSEAKRIEETLRNIFTEVELKFTRTEKEFQKLVLRFHPDIILSEMLVEKFTAEAALEWLKDGHHDIPFILLCERVNESITNAFIRKGAEDCISRFNHALLPLTVLKALERKKIREEKDKIQLELRSEQQRLVKIFDNTPEAIINIGFKGEILEINPPGLKILGFDVDSKLKNRSIFNFIHAGDLKKFKKFHSSVGIGNKRTEKFRIVGSQKKEFWIESNAVPLKNEENHVVSVLMISRDITDLVDATNKFEYSEERFRKLTMNAPVGIFVTDEKGDSIFVNEHWCELAGLRGKQAMGNGWIKALHPEDREKVIKEWHNCASEGKKFQMDYRFQQPNGDVKWLSGSAVSLLNKEGEKIGYIGTVTDITPNKIIEQSLYESEQILRSMEDIANIGYWERNPSTGHGFWSKQMYTIYERNETLGMPTFAEFIEYIHPDDRESIGRYYELMELSSEKKRLEIRLLLHGKKIKHIVAIAQYVLDPLSSNGKKVVGVAMDVTDGRKNSIRANDTKNNFIE